MILHLTKKLADKLKMSPAPVAVEDEFLSWRANYVQEHSCRFVVFMNDASRFTVVINEATAAKLKKLPELFFQTLRETLLATCINPEVADRYIADLGEITYAKNSDRKKTAQLNRNTETSFWGSRRLTDDVEISMYANSDIYNVCGRAEDVVVPNKKMVELLGRYGLPVRKSRAFDLNVCLELDGKNAVRRLRVPANITFERLHQLLQSVFSWKDHHLCHFEIFREWDEKRPDIEPIVRRVVSNIDPNTKSMAGVKLSDYLPEYRKILYIYDYGDDWHHYIEVENVIDDCGEELPLLLSGEGDAPPEDVGGPGGFSEFLKIIADPNHEGYEHLTAWAKEQWWGPFDFEWTARMVKN